jgi:hypothetical protein
MVFSMAYSGKYKVKNPEKYVGDVNDVVYRSLWELYCFKWCDGNDSIARWGSEVVVIPYIYEGSQRRHRYFVDLYLEHTNGKRYIIEVKPKKETKKPEYPGKRTKRYLNESMTFIKNQNKWEAAERYAQNNGMEFQIWTEDTLHAMGIMKMKNALPTLKPISKRKKK